MACRRIITPTPEELAAYDWIVQSRTVMNLYDALVEVTSNKSSFASEPSYGTHFFQDLVESQIFPLALNPEEPGDHLNRDFIKQAENQIQKFIPEETQASRCIKVIHVPTERPGYHLELIMDEQSGEGYLTGSKSK